MSEDPRLTAARYRAARDGAPTDDGDAGSAERRPASGSTAAERAAYVETALQQAIRRGEFDDLPGAGKPLEGMGTTHDPDWWIRRKIQSEQLTGLGPPALMLRVEDAELAAVTDFNRRVIEARRQLLGGPPVVTATREVDDEVAAWRARRDAHSVDDPSDKPDTRRKPSWWRRRRG
jgi:hypothetical protein